MADLLLFLVLALQLFFATGTELTKRNDDIGLITIKNGDFVTRNGSSYRFYGTNAYWVQMLTDDDMERVFHDIATADLQVVRIWAFNDVAQKPSSGTYFQILQNGQATVNGGPDGLQRLDKAVALAVKYNLKLILTLTNNWGIDRPEPSVSFRPRNNGEAPLPRGYLSNDYGGMDRYNRAFGSEVHDDFYTKPAIISAFKNYLSHVVPRYVNNPAVLAWELANDPRCYSTLRPSSSCSTHTITNWVANISSYVKSLDSSHLVTAGDGGFYCVGCPKLHAPANATKQVSPGGPSFDGSFGVDTEDIISISTIDFGSFQLFPNQVEYYPTTKGDFAIAAISHGSRWVLAHSDTATAYHKPEVLTAFAIVTKANWPFFVPFNSSTRPPPDAPCGGVADFQQDYAFVAWTTLALGENVQGTLEYQWQQKGLDEVPYVKSVSKRQTTGSGSPQDGGAHYQDQYTGQNAQQVTNSIGGPP